MTGYKKGSLERQCFSEVNMSTGSTFLKKKNCGNNQQIPKMWRNLCAMEKAETQSRMLVIFMLSSSTALKTDTILSWKSLHGVRNTSRSHCV